MKIYIVESGIEYTGDTIEGVFLTKEAAQEFASQFTSENKWMDTMLIEIWETDTNKLVESISINGPRRAQR